MSGRRPAGDAERRNRLAQRLAAARRTVGAAGDGESIPRLPPGEAAPLSFAQERLYFLERLYAGESPYTIARTVRLLGPLDADALAAALAAVVARHDVLRSRIESTAAGLYQVAEPGAVPRLLLVALEALPEASRPIAARRVARRMARRPFDLARPPLVRAALLRSSPHEHLLLLSIHHVAFDGWSLGILFDELSSLYHGERESGRTAQDDEVPLRFADYASWERRRWSEAADGELEHWRRRLDGLAPLDLPGDRSPPALRTARGGFRFHRLDARRMGAVREVAMARRATPFTVLATSLFALLARLTGATDLAIGVPVAARRRRELERLIGCFVDTVVVRARLAGDPPVGRALDIVRDATTDALAHQGVPFGRVVEAAAPERSLSRTPLVEVLFSYQNTPQPRLRLAGVEAGEAEVVDRGTADFALTLAAEERGAELAVTLVYSADLFDAATAERLLGAWARLLEGIVDGLRDQPAADRAGRREAHLSELPLLSPAEWRQVIAEWGSSRPHPAGDPFPQRFARRAAEIPEATALIHGHERITYRELHRRTELLAHRLRRLGTGPEVPVAVCGQRTPDLVVALLAVLAAGGAYVPLDPAYPAERLRFILEDAQSGTAGAPLLLVDPAVAACLPSPLPRADSRVLPLAADDAASEPEEARARPPLPPVTPRQLAYLIYTSGSTGRPKAVAIEHRNLAARIDWADRAFAAAERTAVLAATSVCFDLSVFEIFCTLAAGGTVVLAANALELPELPARDEVTLLNLVPSAAAALLEHRALPPAVRTVNLAGEPLRRDLVDRIHACSPAARVLDLYGPSEDTTYSTAELVAPEDRRQPTIGRPLPGTRARVLDRHLRPLPPGVPGELFLGGVGLARGYHGRPAATAERFVPDPFAASPEEAGSRLYRTGDQVRWRADGKLEFLGRLDHQVKLRGFRIELGEVEVVLCRHPEVREGAAAVRDGRLVAYAEAAEREGLQAKLHRLLAQSLPDFMRPADLVLLASLPRTPNGKVDRRRLPAPARQVAASGAAPPSGEVEEAVAEVWRTVLGAQRVGREDRFFDLGGTSLQLLEVQRRLAERFGRELPVVELFRASTVRDLAALLEPMDSARGNEEVRAPRRRHRPRAAADGRIAVVGLACRFPGAADPEALWQRLLDGDELIRRFTPAELIAAGVPASALADSTYVPARGVLEDADRFDADFFGVTPREAALLDPQHRLFLETCWEALESAGCDPGRFAGAVGVFAGAGASGYLRHNLWPDRELRDGLAAFQAAIANDKDYLPSRVAYKLDLHGPAVAVQTACSTSLVAVHLACRSLSDGECDVALAGGVTVPVPPLQGYRFDEGGILSPDGRCRAFDADAAGTVPGSGAGVVALKRLDDALADGDPVRAVILGTAINNDGAVKVGYTAPGVEGQAEVIAAALEAAGIEAASVGYVEAHGTGTPLGDPIEVAALRHVFAGTAGRCALGSIKSNLGHTDAAAGVAGLIKTVLAVERGQVPASLHFRQANARLGLEETPFFVPDRTVSWPRPNGPRRAGVSSFGIGGTNAHAVLEEPPPRPPAAEPERRVHLLVLSGRSAAALDAQSERLAAHLAQRPEAPLADVAWTLASGRRGFREHRAALVAPDAATAARELVAGRHRRAAAADPPPPVVFLFPGQGSQHPRMGEGLYRTEAAYRSALDRCAELAAPALGCDLRELILPPAGGEERAAARLAETEITQPAVFAVSYAAAELWRHWGVEPAAVLGHSVGEYVAACVAGVFSLADAVALVVARGRLVAALPRGAMLAVDLDEEATRQAIDGLDGVDVAAVNAPRSCVVAGAAAAVAAAAVRFAAAGVEHRRLRVSHAFHSPLMDGALEPFRHLVAKVPLSSPAIPLLSGRTGAPTTAEQALDPEHWAAQLRQPVRFSAAAAALLDDHRHVFLEVGPGRGLTALLRRHPGSDRRTAVATLPHPRDRRGDEESALGALGALWTAGVEPAWERVHAAERRQRVVLPTYPFQRRRHWIDPPAEPVGEAPKAASGWRLWAPLWHEALPPAPQQSPARFLVLGDAAAEEMTRRLEARGAAAASATAAEALRRLESAPAGPLRVVFLPTSGAPSLPSLLALAHACNEHGATTELVLVAAGKDARRPARGRRGSRGAERTASAAAAAVDAAAIDAAHAVTSRRGIVDCRRIELAAAPERLLDDLADELLGGDGEPVVALARGRRWLRRFAALPAPPAEPSPRAAVVVFAAGVERALAAARLLRPLAGLIVAAPDAPSPAAREDSAIEQVRADPGDAATLDALSAALGRGGRPDLLVFAVAPPVGGDAAAAVRAELAAAAAVAARLRPRVALLAPAPAREPGEEDEAAIRLLEEAAARFAAAGRGEGADEVRWSALAWRGDGPPAAGAAVGALLSGVVTGPRGPLLASPNPLDLCPALAAGAPRVEPPGDEEPSPPGREAAAAAPFEPPRDEEERTVAEIWRRFFGVARVGAEDEFLALGGDSLLAAQVMARVRAELEVELPVSAIFEHGTVAGLAAACREARRGAAVLDDAVAEALKAVEGLGPDDLETLLEQQERGITR